MKRPIVLSIAVILSACTSKVDSNTAVPMAEAPKIETASPDLAIKSWWRVRDYQQTIISQQCERSNTLRSSGLYKEVMQKIATGPALNEIAEIPGLCNPEQFERNIVEVKVESDTRAVVIAAIKQATPVPPGLTLTADEAKSRADAARYKYVLEKVGNEWRVAEVYTLSRYTADGDAWQALTESAVRPLIRTSVWGVQ